MAKDYKITVDESMLANNEPRALEKKMRDMGAAGWSLMHVTSIMEHGELLTKSRIYLFWERETQPGQGEARQEEPDLEALLKKLGEKLSSQTH